jgi:XTP/dITP diphosphohydrolase
MQRAQEDKQLATNLEDCFFCAGPNHWQAVTTLIIATRNDHKVGEIRAVLASGFDFRTLRDFPGAPRVIEDAGTFAGNASKKSIELARWLARSAAEMDQFMERKAEVFCLADDSGLEVDVLNGAPGVHSARFAAEGDEHGNTPDAANNRKLLRLLDRTPLEKRTARFRCVIALTRLPSGPISTGEVELETEVFEGACEGRIIERARGARGFGYDPLFVPEGFEQTFAELGEEVKNRISHRARALRQVNAWFHQRTSSL